VAQVAPKTIINLKKMIIVRVAPVAPLEVLVAPIEALAHKEAMAKKGVAPMVAPKAQDKL
jgi:hypothetical protein